jgi:hypothetical protein
MTEKNRPLQSLQGAILTDGLPDLLRDMTEGADAPTFSKVKDSFSPGEHDDPHDE